MRALRGSAGFFALLAAYAIGHVLVRLLISPTLALDDAREAVLGQTLEWGYQHRQPPLYNWLVWGALRMFGVGVPALTIVKYAVLSIAFACLYASARLMLRDARLPGLAAFSILLIVPISWVYHQGLTHSVAALAVCALTFYLLLRLEASGSWGAYLAFGSALGLGMLSKFTYAVFAVSLLAAALTVKRFRARVWSPRILVAFAVAGMLVLPYALWFATHEVALERVYEEELHVGPGNNLAEAVAGLYYLVRVTFYYLAPLCLVFLAIFPAAYRSHPAASSGAHPGGRVLERFFLWLLALLAAGALTASFAYLKYRWMSPAFALFPLYAVWRLDGADIDPRRLRRYAGVLVATEVAIVAGLLLITFGGRLLPRSNRLNDPYDAIAAQVAAAGFTGGTIVGGYGALAGNLRVRFPNARVVSLEHPYYVPPGSGGGQCLITWEKGTRTTVPDNLRAWLAMSLNVTSPGDPPVRVAEAPYRFTPGHIRRVFYVLLPGGVGDCQ